MENRKSGRTNWPSGAWAITLALLLPCVRASASGPTAQNLDFEQGRALELPPGWFAPYAASGGFRVSLSTEFPHGGKGCLQIRRDAGGRLPACIALQTIDALPYRGCRVRLSGWLRFAPSDSEETIGSARLWIRAGGNPWAYADMEANPVRSSEWTFANITCEVSDNADSIGFGGYLNMHGTAWFDDVSLSVVGRAGEGNQRPSPLGSRGVENLVAFGRLLGYVRHFHPSNEAASTDWDAFAIAGVQTVESARSASDLKTRLLDLFGPIAPTVRIGTKRLPPLTIESLRRGAPRDSIIGWQHRGWAGRFPEFFAERRITAATEAPGDSVLPIGSEVNASLGGGVWCSVPLTLFAPARPGVLVASAPDLRRPDGWVPTGNDRATRLAGVILFWNVIEHFHPYLDVSGVSWRAQLPRALRAAAVDSDGAAYEKTIRRLAALTRDGHTYVTSPYRRVAKRWPFTLSFVGEKLILTQVDSTLIAHARIGDEVIAIQGRSTREWVAKTSPLLAGATTRHIQVRVARELASFVEADTLTLEVRSPNGQVSTARARLQSSISLRPALPDSVQEIKPGIWYLDLNRITDSDLGSAIPRINAGKGVIFDLRGYPRYAFRSVIAHIAGSPVQYPPQAFPVILHPDRSDTAFAWQTYTIEPASPRIQVRSVFLMDATAISAAETLLGIVKDYHLAELVGEPTAGTNGVVTEVRLPGRYVVSFTGMRVVNHDGSRHYGVGIRPTLPALRTVEGIAAGRDEQLERAIEVVDQ